MRVLTSKDGDLVSYFDNINETQIIDTSLKQILINNYTVAANKGKKFGHFLLAVKLSKNYKG